MFLQISPIWYQNFEQKGATYTPVFMVYGTKAMLVLNLLAFENKKYTAYDCFNGNSPYIKKELIRTLGFVLPYNKGC